MIKTNWEEKKKKELLDKLWDETLDSSFEDRLDLIAELIDERKSKQAKEIVSPKRKGKVQESEIR